MEPTFLQNPNWASPTVQMKLLDMIRPLRLDPDPQATFRLFQAEYSGNFRFVYLPFSVAHSTAVLIKWGTNNLILCGGTIGSTHIPGILSGLYNALEEPQNYGASEGFAASARALMVEAPSQWFDGQQQWILAGHSYGGAQLSALAAALLSFGVGHTIHIFTYGSPRPGDESMQTILQRANFWRWFNAEDPVTKIVPHTPEAPILNLLLTNGLAMNINRQVQPIGGRRISITGQVTADETSPSALTIAEPSIIAWMAGSNAFEAQSHSLVEYYRRFGLMLDLPSQTVRPRADGVRGENPVVLTSRQRAEQIQEAVVALDGQALPATGIQFAIPQKDLRYKIRKRGTAWVVMYQGEIVAIGPGKRQARKLARAGNRVNRSLV